VRALLNFYLDGPDQDKLDCSQFADYILDRASIGSVIASSLGEEDPETNPLYENLSDEEFAKIAYKFNEKRDVYGFISIVSFSYGMAKIPWISHISNYINNKANTFL
jgi:hypothetical protein